MDRKIFTQRVIHLKEKIAVIGAEVEAGKWRNWKQIFEYSLGNKTNSETPARWPDHVNVEVPESQFLRDQEIALGRFRISPKEMGVYYHNN